MELVRGLYNLKKKHHGCVATIGNFDGIHIGHQKIISNLLNESTQHSLPSCIINFEPYPQEFFLKDKAPARLSRLTDKTEFYQQLNIDRLLLLKFNQHLKNLGAEQFIFDVLVKGLGIKHLIVGDDFLFGKDRKGNFELLKQQGTLYGFSVEKTPTVTLKNKRVSSTRIRNCLQEGDFTLAKQLLSRPFSICARVVHGAKMGRTINFPTANLPIHRKSSPVHGVFAVQTIINGKTVNGVANVGKRPTVNGVNTLLEVHLFDFKQNLYGKRLRVDLLYKIREEQKFDSFELLKAQILKDVVTAKSFFKTATKT